METFLNFLTADSPGGISHEGYLSVMMTILGIVIAVLSVIFAVGAIIVSVLAWYSYTEMIKRAEAKAEEAAKNISLAELTARAEEIAKKIATSTSRIEARKTARELIDKNKDQWMEDIRLSMELAAAQKEPETAAEASITAEGQEIGKPYPSEENTNARSARRKRNTGPSDPAPSS